MGNLTHTVSGDIASFRSAARVPIESLKCHFKPKQDLHGYDRPWPAGGGKNLFDQEKYSLLANYPNQGAYSYWYTAVITLKPNTNYTVSFDQSFTTSTVQYTALLVYTADDASLPGTTESRTAYYPILNYQSQVVHFTTGSYGYIRYGIQSINQDKIDEIYNNYNMQIEEGNTATSYEPYKNICPIEGWNSLTTYQSSINIWDEQWEIGSIHNDNGKDVVASNTIRSKNYIRVYPKYKYYCYVNHDSQSIKIVYYDQNKEYAGDYLWRGGSNMGTLTIPDNVHYIRFATRNIYGETYCNDISINYPHTDTSYHPYLGKTIPITFPVLGKNKFNWNVEQGHASPTSSDAAAARTYPLNTYIIGMSSSNYYRDNYTNWVLNPSVSNGVISFESGAASGYGIGFPLDLIPGQTYYLSGTVTNQGDASVIYYDKNGAKISSQYYRLNRTITIPENTVISMIVFHTNEPHTAYTFSNIQLQCSCDATNSRVPCTVYYYP